MIPENRLQKGNETVTRTAEVAQKSHGCQPSNRMDGCRQATTPTNRDQQNGGRHSCESSMTDGDGTVRNGVGGRVRCFFMQGQTEALG